MFNELLFIDYFTTDLQDNIRREIIRTGDEAGFETPAPESLDDNHEGKPGVDLGWPFMPVDVTVHHDNNWDELERALTVSFDAGALQSSTWSTQESEAHRDEFVDTVIDFVCSLAVSNDPEYVAAHDPVATDSDPVIPTTRPIIDDINRLPVLGIYSRDMVETLGGRERVLETPAWRVEELDNGQILVITDEPPWGYGAGTANATEYLLEGGENSGSSPSEPDLSDPFAALDPGDYGTDVCVHRKDIAPEFHNEDLRLVRIYRDGQGNLRRVEGGGFVRNVVVDPENDEAFVRGMLAEIPPNADNDDLLVSALLHSAIPSSFVRLDDSDGENVVSRVLDLNVETNKIDLLVSLGDAAQHEDKLDPHVIESALDSLADLEDVDGIDRYIEQNLL